MRRLGSLIRDACQGLGAFITSRQLDPLPIRKGWSDYRLPQLRADVHAGVNVALLAFPQGMAYAVIADLPIHFGILSGAVAAMVAPLLAGSRHTILGPTNATAFMIFSYFAVNPAIDKEQVMPLLLLMVGIMLVVGSLLSVADLIQYISRSVVVGYITGAAVLIIANQLRHVLGVSLDDPEVGESARTFFTIVWDTFAQLKATQWQPLVLGLLTAALWFGLKRTPMRRLPIFALTLLIVTLIHVGLRAGGLLQVETFEPFRLADLKPSLPSFSSRGVFQDISKLFGVAFSVAFLASLENSVMSKTLASRSGDRPNMNQDMLSVGASNLAVAFVGGMPASGSLTRSALNFSSGAASRLSSIISGLLCGLGAVLLGRYMDAVPKCALAVLVICIAASLINRRHIRISLRATRSDAAVLISTFLAALLMPLHVAIFLGVAISIMLYLRKASQPYLTEYEFNEEGQLAEAGEKRGRPDPAISIVHVEGELFFGAAELFRTQIQRTCADPNLRIIILRLKNARHLDATSVMALEELIASLRASERDVIISGASKDVYRVLKNSDMVDVIGRENIFLNSPRNPNLSTRKALVRAQEILGTTQAEVRIFFDPTKDPKTVEGS